MHILKINSLSEDYILSSALYEQLKINVQKCSGLCGM